MFLIYLFTYLHHLVKTLSNHVFCLEQNSCHLIVIAGVVLNLLYMPRSDCQAFVQTFDLRILLMGPSGRGYVSQLGSSTEGLHHRCRGAVPA